MGSQVVEVAFSISPIFLLHRTTRCPICSLTGFGWLWYRWDGNQLLLYLSHVQGNHCKTQNASQPNPVDEMIGKRVQSLCTKHWLDFLRLLRTRSALTGSLNCRCLPTITYFPSKCPVCHSKECERMVTSLSRRNWVIEEGNLLLQQRRHRGHWLHCQVRVSSLNEPC